MLVAANFAGGYAPGTAGDYVLWTHSQLFVQVLELGNQHPKTSAHLHEIQTWMASRTSLQLSTVQQQCLAWSDLPQEHWPLSVTSSIAYPCFKNDMPNTGLKGPALLTLPLRHSSVFTKKIPPRVREMRDRSHCCPKVVCKGVCTLGDFVTEGGQIKVAIISVLPPSICVLYTRNTVDLADRAKAGQGDGAQWSTPPPKAWSFKNAGRARAQTCRIEERQSSQVWEALAMFNVPPKLHNFVLRTVWRKLPVAARRFNFKMVQSPDCSLCPCAKYHSHVLKRCPYLSLLFSIVRRLYGAVVQVN